MGVLDESIGAVFIGGLATTVLFGVTCAQTTSYIRRRTSDGLYLVGTVVLLMLLDALHTALVAHLLYTFVVTDFGNIAELEVIPWTLSSSLVVHIVSDSVVRIFFTRRVWLLSRRNTLVTVSLSALIISTLGFILFVTVKSFELKSVELLFLIHWEICTGLALVMATDFCIAASLCGYLFFSRKGEYTGTNSLINSLCLYTINTGLLTTLCSLGCLVAYVVSPKTLIFIAFYLPISKFYVNAFLASLNARQALRGRAQIAPSSSAKALRLNAFGANSLSTVNHGTSHISGYPGQDPESSGIIAVKVETEAAGEDHLSAISSVKFGEAF